MTLLFHLKEGTMYRRKRAPLPKPKEVLTRAVLRAAEALGLASKDLAEILGVSPATLSRLQSERAIDPDSKEGELALLFLRMYRSLDALLGGDADRCRKWLHAKNLHLAGTPAALIKTVTGLVYVNDYLD